MKKLLLSLLVVLSMQAYADVVDTLYFDFTDPTSLNVNPPYSSLERFSFDADGDVVMFTNKTITQGLLELSFSVGDAKEGVALNHSVIIDEQTGDTIYTSYSLAIRRRATMTVNGKDCKLISVSFEGDIGALSSINVGSLNTLTKTWTPDGAETSSATFKNGPNADTRITRIKVIYSRNPMPLRLLSVDPVNGSTIDHPFTSMKLHFDLPVKLATSDVITLKSTALTEQKVLMPSASGNEVTLSADEPISKAGLYTVSVPASKFANAEGYPSEAVTTQFRIRVPLQVDSIVPANGSFLETMPDSIHLFFEKEVKLDGSMNGEMAQNGQIVGIVTFSVDPANKKHVIGKLVNVEGDMKAESVWAIVIPEKAIHSAWYGINGDLDSWNSEMFLQYRVQKKNHYAMQSALALIGKTGIGFPSASCASRKALQEAIDNDASVEELDSAMAAFYNESDVTMPEDAEWYLIAGVNSANNPSKVYLAFDGDGVSLTTSVSKASSFQAIKNNDGVYMFLTSDKKHYLHVLTTRQDLEVGSTKNVTDRQSLVNNLTFSKLVAGADSTKTLGKLTMTGVLINTNFDKDTTTAVIDHATVKIFDAPKDAIYFSDALSSAFVFEKGKAPYDPSLYVHPEAVISSNGSINEGETLLLRITNVQKATLADSQKPYILNGSNRADVQGDVLKATETDNVFEVNTSKLSEGSYTLVLPVGTFSYEKLDKEVSDVELRVAFTVKKYVEPEPDFQYTYNGQFSCLQTLIMMQENITIVADTDLNDFVLFANIGNPYTAMIPDSTKTVEIVNYYNPSIVYAKGHFVPYPKIEKYYPEFGLFNVQAIKLVLDEPIKKGDINRATVAYIIPRATFGDANFGQWLADKNSIAPEKCIVNDRIDNMTFLVNNDYAIEREQKIKGDVNGDKVVDVADIAAIIDVMSGNWLKVNADVNDDDVVDVADIATVIDIMTGQE